jgi:hypothetical protein
MTIAEAMKLLSPRTMSRLREHAKAIGVDEAKVASDLLEMMAQDARALGDFKQEQAR